MNYRWSGEYLPKWELEDILVLDCISTNYSVANIIYSISLWPALLKIKEKFSLDGIYTSSVPIATYIYGSTPEVETVVCPLTSVRGDEFRSYCVTGNKIIRPRWACLNNDIDANGYMCLYLHELNGIEDTPVIVDGKLAGHTLPYFSKNYWDTPAYYPAHYVSYNVCLFISENAN